MSVCPVLPSETRPEFFMATLPALTRIARAFPPLCDDIVALLVQVGQICQAQLSCFTHEGAAGRTDICPSRRVRVCDSTGNILDLCYEASRRELWELPVLIRSLIVAALLIVAGPKLKRSFPLRSVYNSLFKLVFLNFCTLIVAAAINRDFTEIMCHSLNTRTASIG